MPLPRTAGRPRTTMSSHLPHQLLDRAHVLGQLGELGAQLLLIGHGFLGAVALQPEVGPDGHGDHHADDEDDPHADDDRAVVRPRAGGRRRVAGRQGHAGHMSLSFIWSSRSAPIPWESSLLPSARSASMMVSAVSRNSNGASSKYFMALPSSDSSS